MAAQQPFLRNGFFWRASAARSRSAAKINLEQNK